MASGNTIGSVFVRVRPKVKDFRRDTKDEIERDLSQPLDVEVTVTPIVDKKGSEKAGKEARKIVEREAGEAKIKFNADYDGVSDAIERVKDQLKMLERQEIIFTANKDGLEEVLAEIRNERLPDAQVEIEWVDDEQGYQAILKKIEEIRRADATKTIEFSTDDASLAQAQREAQAALDSIEASKPIEFSYVEDGDGYRTLMDRINQLRRERVEVKVDLNVSDGALTRLERETRAKSIALRTHLDLPSAAMAEGQLAALSRDRWVELKPRLSKAAMAELTGAFMAIAGLNSIRTLVDQIRNIAMNFDEWAVAVGTASAAIGSLVSVGTVGLGSLLSIAGDTLQVFQGLAAAPALLLSGAAVLQTWSAIWDDFGAALMGIPGVLEQMPPQAQRAVGAIQELNDEVNGAVQNNFWGEMTDEVERFTASIGPSVVQVMGNTATVIGRTVSSMLDYTEALKNNGSLDEFTRNHTVAMDRVGKGAEVFFEALMNMGIQGSKYLPELGRGFQNLADDFSGFMDKAIQTGQFDQWIRNSIESIKSLGQFSKATWDMLAGLTRAFENVGGAGLHEMADGMERVADFVNRGDTQVKLEGIFRAAMDGAASAGTGFADLAKTVWEYDEAIQMALRTTGQLAGDFMTQISKLNFDVPIRGFEDLMGGLINFVNRARPGFQSIVDIFGRLGSIGGEVAREIAHGMNLTMGAIDGFIARIEGPLINAIHPLTRVFEDLAAIGTPILFGMANTIGVLLDAFAALPAPIQNVITLLAILGRTGVGTAISGIVSQFATMRTRVTREMVMLQRQVPQAFDSAAGSVERRSQVMATRVQARMNLMRSTMKNVFGAGGLMGALGGGWGIAIAGAVAALSSFAGASAEAEAAQQRLKDSVNDVTGAVEDQAVVDAYDQMTAGADGAMEKMNAWFTELSGNSSDLEDIFSRTGTSVGELAKGLQGPADEVRGIADAARELADLDSAFSFVDPLSKLQEGDFSGVSSGAKELYQNLDLSGLSAAEARTAIEAIAAVYGPIADEAEHVKIRTGEIGDAAKGAADGVESIAAAADGLPIHMEATVDAMKTLADETSSAEQRVDALDAAMRALNGEEFTLEEQIANATRSMDTGMKEIERLAQDGGFSVSNAFNEAGEFDLSHIDAVKVSEPVAKVRESILGEVDIIQQKFDEGLIGDAEYESQLGDLESKYNDSLKSIAEELGMTSEQTEAFLSYMDEYNAISFDPKELGLVYNGAETAEQAQADWEKLRELGIELDESEYIAKLDADGDGFVSEEERVVGLGNAFDDLLFEAGLSGDSDEYNRVLNSAAAEGYIFNGKTFVATLDADGQPTEEGLALALERGYMWDGTKYVGLLEADGSQSAEEVERAKARLGDYEDVYNASLKAGMSPADAAALATATVSADEYEGDYEAVLAVLQNPGDKEAMDALMSELNGLDGKEALVRIKQQGAETVIERSSAAGNAARGVQDWYIATFGETGAANVKAKGDSAADAANRVPGLYSAIFGESGGTNVKKKGDGAADAANRVPGLYSAIFGEKGGDNVRAKGDGAADAANRVPGFRSAVFGESGGSSVIGMAGRVKTQADRAAGTRTITFHGVLTGGMAAGLAALRNSEGSLSGSRFKPQKVNAYANGGFESHVAQIAHSTPSTPIRIWAEPETGGEAYIPLSQSKRGRSLAIWQEVGKRFGVYADGGVVGGKTVDSGGDIWNINMQNGSVSVDDLMNEADHRRRRRGRRGR